MTNAEFYIGKNMAKWVKIDLPVKCKCSHIDPSSTCKKEIAPYEKFLVIYLPNINWEEPVTICERCANSTA